MTSFRTKAFVSYSHEDEEYRKRLRIHLEHYVREQNIDVWDDKRIALGADWKEEIKAAIAVAKVAILLVSADFLASGFIAHDELPPLLESAKQKGTLIFVVILSPCAFQNSKLARFQAINKPSEPLISMQYWQQEQVWAQLAEQVANALKPISEVIEEAREGKVIDCWKCNGKGFITGSSMSDLNKKLYDCHLCNGSGKLWVPSGYREEWGKGWFSSLIRFVICQSCGVKKRYDNQFPLPTHCSACGALYS